MAVDDRAHGAPLDLDRAIDQLFQGPLDGFTAARNALAKTARRPEVKALVKPTVPAWAVNQLHWRHRGVVDELVAAAEQVHAAHRQRLAGAPADVRQAEDHHRDVLRRAVACAREVLTAEGVPATNATIEAIRETLQALPSPEANGRLTRALTARGLDALTGIVVAERPTFAAALRLVKSDAASSADDQAAVHAREARETEAARQRAAAREAAERGLEEARSALAQAEADVARVTRELDAAEAARRAAEAAVRRAERDVEKLAESEEL